MTETSPSREELEAKVRSAVKNAIPCTVYEHDEGCECVVSALTNFCLSLARSAWGDAVERCAKIADHFIGCGPVADAIRAAFKPEEPYAK